MTKQEAIKILVKECENLVGHYRYQNKETLNMKEAYILAIKALQGQIEHEKYPIGWVSVKDRLPEDKAKIIDGENYYKNLYVQYGNGNLTIAFYDEELRQWFTPLGLRLDGVSMWCDCLPEPPE